MANKYNTHVRFYIKYRQSGWNGQITYSGNNVAECVLKAERYWGNAKITSFTQLERRKGGGFKHLAGTNIKMGDYIKGLYGRV